MAVDVFNNLPKNHVKQTVAATDAATAKLLLHELQLGQELNESVHQKRRADFSLMLAMLCDDVTEQSQFILPQASAIDKQADKQVLRKHFDLPAEAPLALANMTQINQYNQSQYIADDDLVSLHLSNALSPNPLTFRDDKQYISADILTNTSVVCQAKHGQQPQNKPLNKPLTMHVDNWLKAVQTSLVKSSVMAAVTV